MEHESRPSYANSIMAELHDWNRFEKELALAFQRGDKDGLDKRRFGKLALSEYERIANLYAGNTVTRDEKMWFKVLQFQKTRLEKSLYPKLITRLLRRLIRKIQQPSELRNEAYMARQAGMNDFYTRPKSPTASQSEQQGQEIGQQQSPKRYGPDLGKRKWDADKKQRPHL